VQSQTLDPSPVNAAPNVEVVVDAASVAQPAWGEMSVAARATCLGEAAERLGPRAEELARLLAEESGKPIRQARFEVEGAIALLRGNAWEGRRLSGRVLPTEGSAGTETDFAWTRREPLGVIAAILPFNFPVELFVEKCAAALVGGNAVVVKPPAEDPLAVLEFRHALLDAGVPEGVLGCVQGDADVGAALASAAGVDAVSLTGSTKAGLAVAAEAAKTLRPLHLELGGNNASLVLADADLDLVSSELLYGRLLMNGQACAASKRILVDASIHDELAGRLVEGVRGLQVGDALDPATDIGPLITARAAETVASQVARARSEGARLVHGSGTAAGRFFEPCVLANVAADAAVAIDDEIFGPVFVLIETHGPAEALELANSSSFGLMASVFTADLGLAVALAERLQAGGVVVNGTDNYRPPVLPFGGVKLSGRGREGLGYTIEELTTEKTIVLRRFRRPLER
jgi:acyl-CoA reductase-like NAD-dependent aldehyde dehydrogenase